VSSRRTLRRGFALVAIAFGVAYALLTPPFESPDEYNHFYRAYHVSEGGVLPRRERVVVGDETASMVGSDLPASLMFTAGQVPRRAPGDPPPPATREVLSRLRAIDLRPDERTFTDFRNTALYAPIVYAPQALAVRIARIAEPPPIALLYAGRLGNLAFCTGAIALAIGLAPVQASSLVLVAATPMALSLSASLSADAPLNALAILYVALVFAVAFGARAPGATETIGLVALPVLIALAKQAYAPLALLGLAIPARRLGGPRRLAAVAGISIAGAIAANVVWALLVRGVLDPLEGGSPAFPPMRAERIDWLLGHPLWFAITLARTLRYHLWMYVEQFVGVLGWLEVPLPGWLVVAYVGVLLATAVGDGGPFAPTAWQRVVIAGVTAFAAVGVFVAIYVVWGSPAPTLVTGIQGRYFLPIVTPAVLVFLWCRSPLGVGAARGVIAFAALAQVAALVALLRRFPL
jgi:uncharacterized membrane protein